MFLVVFILILLREPFNLLNFEMLNSVFKIPMLRMPSSKSLWNIDKLMFLFIGLINRMQVAATGGATEDFVGHLVLNDREEALVELEEVVNFLLVVLTDFFEFYDLLLALLHDLVQAAVLLDERLHGDGMGRSLERMYGIGLDFVGLY
jgi:hypothetical protein